MQTIRLSPLVCTLALLAPLNVSAEEIREVYIRNIPGYDLDDPNRNAWAYRLSAGGASSILTINYFDPDTSTGGTEAMGWYNFLTEEFTEFDLDALKYIDHSENGNSYVSGLFRDNKILINSHDFNRHGSGGFDYSIETPSNMVGIANPLGTEVDWLDIPLEKDGKYLSSASSFQVGNDRFETFIPLNTQYYDADVCQTNSSADGCLLGEALVWNAETNTSSAIISSGNNIDDRNSVSWVDTTSGTKAYGSNYRYDNISNTSDSSLWKWTPTEGVTTVVEIPDAYAYNDIHASDVSKDGNMLIGEMSQYSSSAQTRLGSGFIYTDDTGELEVVDPESGYDFLGLYRIYNADQKIIFGSRSPAAGATEAIVYNDGVIETANSFLNISDEYNFSYLNDFNDDGSVILGLACPDGGCQSPSDERRFLIGVPEEETIGRIIDFDVALDQLSEVKSTLTQAQNSIMTAANGAHGNPLARRLDVGKQSAWVTGDLVNSDHYSDASDGRIGAFSYGKNYGPAQINVSIGKVNNTQTLASGGTAISGGAYVNLDFILPSNSAQNVYFTFGAFSYRGKNNTTRSFLNNGNLDEASGKSDLNASSISVRVDAVDYIVNEAGSLSTFAELSLNKSTSSAYSETGSSLFNANYDAQTSDYREFRIGGIYKQAVSDNLNLFSNFELVHNKAERGNKTGDIAGFEFDMQDQSRKTTWAKYGLGFDYSFNDAASIEVSAYKTSVSSAASSWLSVTYNTEF